MLVLIAHAADTHLGKKFSSLGIEERDRDVEEAFKQMMELLVTEHVNILVIAGDLFERPRPNNSTLLFFRDSVKEFLEKGGKIILVNGDHDTPGEAEAPATLLVSRYLNNVYHLKHFFRKDGFFSLVNEGEKVNFFGMGAIKGPRAIEHGKNIMKEIQSAVKTTDGKNIMVSHASIKDYFPLSDGYELDSFPSGIHYYAMGHLHFRMIDKLKDGVIAYPGSLEILNFEEIRRWKKEGKGFFIVDMSADEPVVHQVDLDIRTQEIFEISSEEDIRNLAKEIEAFITSFFLDRKPIVNIEIKESGESLRKTLLKYVERWQKAGAIISLHYKPEKEDSMELDLNAKGEWDELKIVKKIIGDEQVAKLIIDLKNCLSSPENSNCDEIAREITSKKEYWEKALKEWPKERGLETGKNEEKGGKLTKFMG